MGVVTIGVIPLIAIASYPLLPLLNHHFTIWIYYQPSFHHHFTTVHHPLAIIFRHVIAQRLMAVAARPEMIGKPASAVPQVMDGFLLKMANIALLF